uniref:Uncharacterized protein n=1 Tax=Pyramimonas obovata TaxID=1411642 RepID=A0A6T7UVM2_9CHLO
MNVLRVRAREMCVSRSAVASQVRQTLGWTDRSYSSHTHTPSCGSACSTPTSCAPTSPAQDIAYKPAKGGWGYTRTYASNWERIFGKKNKTDDTPTEEAQEKK